MHRIVAAGLALALPCGSALAADAARTQVMLVGTYHFSNPGKDLNNVKAVDVLAADRQREIGKAVTALARFAPTKVAVEWPAQVVQERYPKFRDGQLPESRNEVGQLGFRLAYERGLPAVLGLDVEGNFPFEAVAAWAGNHGRKTDIDAVMASGAKEVEHISSMQLFLVVPKALTPRLRPTLFHNNHHWEGQSPLLLILRSGRIRSTTVRLFLVWMAFHGFYQALPQGVMGAFIAGNDVGMAMDYFHLPAVAKGIAALAAIPLIVAFRVPRELVEVLPPPALVTVVGLAALHSVAWKITDARSALMHSRYRSCIRSSLSSRCCSCFSWCYGRASRSTS